MKIKLHKFLTLSPSVTLCQLLLSALLGNIERRVENIFTDTNPMLAAVMQPKLKLNWLDSPIQEVINVKLLRSAANQQQALEA